ncbi:hypothetical protein AGR13a_Cc210170 [Agrobacterium genomosp. 13 str. CFBP 6927]|uniref:Uncharacterized protein n=1 Tax=Agrobacterium genomosp. 13 str. CFBP 6927 TaxID=1183428 RepID=A0ABM9VDK5_9HYPH|nr:hypothetical protein AGR13a_Cc210170 [Agrobacterium genomosp. 13 str. CFBP 6927]
MEMCARMLDTPVLALTVLEPDTGNVVANVDARNH